MNDIAKVFTWIFIGFIALVALSFLSFFLEIAVGIVGIFVGLIGTLIGVASSLIFSKVGMALIIIGFVVYNMKERNNKKCYNYYH